MIKPHPVVIIATEHRYILISQSSIPAPFSIYLLSKFVKVPEDTIYSSAKLTRCCNLNLAIHYYKGMSLTNFKTKCCLNGELNPAIFGGISLMPWQRLHLAALAPLGSLGRPGQASLPERCEAFGSH